MCLLFQHKASGMGSNEDQMREGWEKAKSGEMEKNWRDVQPSRAAPTALLLGWCLRQHLLQSCFHSMALASHLHYSFR